MKDRTWLKGGRFWHNGENKIANHAIAFIVCGLGSFTFFSNFINVI